MRTHQTYLIKEILRLATPIVSVRLLYMIVGIIGMLLLAQLGKTELAASALVTASTTIIMCIALSPLMSIGIIVGKLYGENKLAQIGNVIRLSWLISIGLGLIVALVLWNFDRIFYSLNQPKELIPYVKSYLHGLALGVIPSFIIASCQQLCFAVRKQNLVVIWGILSLIGSICFGSAFIFGLLGFKKLGFSGWSCGGSIVNWSLMIGVIWYLARSKQFQEFNLFHWKSKIDWQQLATLLKLSWPITVQFSGELLAFGFLNIMVGWLGADQLSIQQILTQSTTFSLIVPMGVSQAVSILLSQRVGQKKYEQIKPLCYYGVYISVACMVLIASIYWITPLTVIHLYLKPDQMISSQIIHLAIMMLALIACTQIIDAGRNILIGGLRGLEDVRVPMWLNIFVMWGIGVPLAYILAFTLREGMFGINLGFLISFIVGALLMYQRFRLKTKKFYPVKEILEKRALNDIEPVELIDV